MAVRGVSLDQLNVLNSHLASALSSAASGSATTGTAPDGTAVAPHDFQKHANSFFSTAKQFEYSLQACQVLTADPSLRLQHEIGVLESEIADLDSLLSKYRKKLTEWEKAMKDLSSAQQKALEFE